MPKGIPISGINKGWFKKGDSFWLGKKRPEIKQWLPSFPKGHEPHNKGQRNGNPIRYKLLEMGKYRELHYWVEGQLGKPNHCEMCRKTEGKFDWANISGQYFRVKEDWIRLCKSCHRKYDKKQ